MEGIKVTASEKSGAVLYFSFWLNYALTASLNALPAWNFTRLVAGISMDSPVAGLRPARAGVSLAEKEPKPMMFTVPPAATVSSMVLMTSSNILRAAALVMPFSDSAIFTMSSSLVTFTVTYLRLYPYRAYLKASWLSCLYYKGFSESCQAFFQILVHL